MCGVEIVRDLLAYIENNKSSSTTDGMLKIIDPAQLRGVASHLLKWLGSQHRFRVTRQIVLDAQSTAAQSFAALHAALESFAQVFTVQHAPHGVVVDFHAALPTQVRVEMTKTAGTYLPPPHHPPANGGDAPA
jgi:hypothetical protein